jgi:hypothetical protein
MDELAGNELIYTILILLYYDTVIHVRFDSNLKKTFR